MRSVLLISLLVLAGTLGAIDTVSPAQNTLAGTATTTLDDTYEDVLSATATMPDAGSLLAVASFCVNASSNGDRTGYWRLLETAFTANSQELGRYLSTNKDTGVATVCHIFTGLASGANTVKLQHKSATAGSPVVTSQVDLILVPLVSDTDNMALDSEVDTLNATGFSTTSASYVAVNGLMVSGITAQHTQSQYNNVVVVASFNSSTTNATAVTGEWKLQYRKDSGSWTDMGETCKRYLSGSNDLGAVSLYGLADSLAAGSYDFQLAVKSNGTASLKTSNATICAVYMGYNGQYFPSESIFSTSNVAAPSAWAPVTGSETAQFPTGGTELVALSSYNGLGVSQPNKTINWRLSVKDTGIVSSSQSVTRSFENSSDYGSGGSAGLFTGLNSGTAYSLLLEHMYTTNSGPSTENFAVLGFSTTTPSRGFRVQMD